MSDIPIVKTEFEDMPFVRADSDVSGSGQTRWESAPPIERHSALPHTGNSTYRPETGRTPVFSPDPAAADATSTELGQPWKRVFPPPTGTPPRSYPEGNSSAFDFERDNDSERDTDFKRDNDFKGDNDFERDNDSERENAVSSIVAPVKAIDSSSAGSITTSERPQHPFSRSQGPPPLIHRARSRLEEKEVADLNMLRPFIRSFGDIQTLISRVHGVQSLITEVGGFSNLRQLVRDMNALQQELNGGGHMGDIGSFITEVRYLRSIERQYTALNSLVEGPNGLRLDVLRYKTQKQKLEKMKRTFDNMKQQFDEISSDTVQRDGSYPRPAPNNMTLDVGNDSVLDHNQTIRRSSAANGSSHMNPARAHLISHSRVEEDPDRDLYETEHRAALSENRKTGSNSIPLGKPQAEKFVGLSNQTNTGVIQKRKEAENLVGPAEKRLRFGDRRTPSLVQPFLADIARAQDQALSANARRASSAHGLSITGMIKNEPYSREDRVTHSSPKLLDAPRTLVPNVTRGWGADPIAPYPVAFLISGQSDVYDWGEKEIKSLRAGFQMPREVYVDVLEKLALYVNATNASRWENMPSDGPQCIIR
jgi:hypothetical protein